MIDMQNTQLRGIYYVEAIRSMLSDSHLSLKEVSKSTNIAYLHLIEIRQGATPKLVEDYLSLIDYAEKYFEGGRKHTPPYDINGKAKVEEMSIYIACEYFEGYDVMVDFGDYTVTKYVDREKYAENIVGMADGYFECFDDPEERAGYAEKIRKYMLEGRSN